MEEEEEAVQAPRFEDRCESILVKELAISLLKGCLGLSRIDFIHSHRLGVTAPDVGFMISSHNLLQEFLRKYGVPENLFRRVCIIIDKLLKDKDLLPELGQEVENIVCALDKDLQGAAATVATTLRSKGQSVYLVLESKPLKWVFKRAARINARRLVLVWKTQWEDDSVNVKVLSSGEQFQVKLSD